jgi:hypothetical protein
MKWVGSEAWPGSMEGTMFSVLPSVPILVRKLFIIMYFIIQHGRKGLQIKGYCWVGWCGLYWGMGTGHWAAYRKSLQCVDGADIAMLPEQLESKREHHNVCEE